MLPHEQHPILDQQDVHCLLPTKVLHKLEILGPVLPRHNLLDIRDDFHLVLPIGCVLFPLLALCALPHCVAQGGRCGLCDDGTRVYGDRIAETIAS